MNLVVDTNIVFSTLLNPHSIIGDLLMNIQDRVIFFAPELLKDELKRYSHKIKTYSKLSAENLYNAELLVLSNINFVSEDLISEESWLAAFDLTKDVDEDDTPFIALAIELNANLWTGDKALYKGISKKGSDIILTTEDFKKLLK